MNAAQLGMSLNPIREVARLIVHENQTQKPNETWMFSYPDFGYSFHDSAVLPDILFKMTQIWNITPKDLDFLHMAKPRDSYRINPMGEGLARSTEQEEKTGLIAG